MPGGIDELYDARRKPARSLKLDAGARRRKFFDLAKLTKAPIACEAVRRIDELFEIERAINGEDAELRLAASASNRSRRRCAQAWLCKQRERVSGKAKSPRPSSTA